MISEHNRYVIDYECKGFMSLGLMSSRSLHACLSVMGNFCDSDLIVFVILLVPQQVMNMNDDDPRRLDEIRKYAAIYGRFDCKRKPEKPLTLHEVSLCLLQF